MFEDVSYVLKFGEKDEPPSGGASTLNSHPAEGDRFLALPIGCNTEVKSRN